MARFRRLKGSQSVSNFFRSATDLKTLQKQKGASSEPELRFSDTRFQFLSRRFWAFSNKAKLVRDISSVESRKTWKSRFGEFEIVFGFVFGKFTQKKVFWAPMWGGSEFPKMSKLPQGLYRIKNRPMGEPQHKKLSEAEKIILSSKERQRPLKAGSKKTSPKVSLVKLSTPGKNVRFWH